jgi:hypothetical protein
LVNWPKSQKRRPISGARLELVDDYDDWREFREDGWHRSYVLASQMMKWMDETQGGKQWLVFLFEKGKKYGFRTA